MKQTAASPTTTTPSAMLLLVVLLLLTASLLAVGDAWSRIVGGADASIEDFPYQASLLVDHRHSCGACLVGAGVALTAAHCVVGVTLSYLSVRVGSDRLDKGGSVLPVTDVVPHPQYDAATLDYDVAVVTLGDDAGVTTPPTAVPVALVAESYYPLPDTPVVVSGWGSLQDGAEAQFSEQLQAVSLPVVRSSVCNDGYGGAITERMLCAGEAWKGACDGDAGGPAPVTPDNNATVLLLGVVAWNYGCDLSGYPTVITSVASVRSWIRDTAGV